MILRPDTAFLLEPWPATQRWWRGQVVRHRHGGYRGLIVEWDRTCQRSEAWRERLFRSPSAEQPWYTLLVDGESTSSYVAEEDLLAAEPRARIRHPLVHFYFQGPDAGGYRRNDRPWIGRLGGRDCAR